MTYQASEASKHDGKPVELFRYEGTYQNFYYTSGQKVISFQAPDEASPNDYIPLAMKRSGVPQTTQDDDNAEVTIEMPVSTDLVAIYGFQISPPALFLTIYRGHAPGEYVRYWSGEVENIQVARGTATVRVPSGLASALSTDFPNVYYQTPCNHTLFDPRCGVAPEDWTVTTSIDAIDGVNVTVDDIGTLDDMMLGGDALLPSGERRMIVAQTGNVITLNYPFASADPTDAITLMTGCDLAWAGDCKLRYDNTRRFGGFPFIPPKNIFRTGLEPGKDVSDESCLPPIFTGLYRTFVFQANPAFTDGRESSAIFKRPNDIQPNGPGGRVLGDWITTNDDTVVEEVYEVNSPDPFDNLNGQLLERVYYEGPHKIVIEMYHNVLELGGYQWQIQYPGGSISLDTPITITTAEWNTTGITLATGNVNPGSPSYFNWTI